ARGRAASRAGARGDDEGPVRERHRLTGGQGPRSLRLVGRRRVEHDRPARPEALARERELAVLRRGVEEQEERVVLDPLALRPGRRDALAVEEQAEALRAL